MLDLGYYVALAEAYRHADMGQIYPIARGSAPLLMGLASLLVLHEAVAPLAALGIAILCGGVALMAFAKGTRRPLGRAGAGFALLTALLICGYTLVDGLGARAAGALFVIDAVPLPLFVLWSGAPKPCARCGDSRFQGLPVARWRWAPTGSLSGR